MFQSEAKMVSKDQSVGAIIFIVCVVIGVLYTTTLLIPQWLGIFGVKASSSYDIRLWVIALPVLVGLVAVMGIGGWIGWTMARTPPPKPMEDLVGEVEAEQKAPSKEEKKKPEEKESEAEK